MLRPFCAVVATLLAAFSAAQAAESAPRPESQQEYWAQVDRKDWSAAVTAAEQLVAAARETAAQQPLALADALVLLGNAQYGAKNYDAAERAYTESLQSVERYAGAASPKTLDPLRGLGYTLAAGNRHKEAVAPLERALLIDRRSYGLYDIGQQNVLRQLAESLVKTGRTADAERHVTYLIQLGERAYGRNDPRQVPILCFAADWHADIGDFIGARAIYRRAIQLVDQKLGPNDPAAVDPLRALAGTFTQEVYYSTLGLRTQTAERMPIDADGNGEVKQINPKYLNAEGEKALDRAVKILELQPPSAHDTLVAVLIQAGDWYQIKHVPEKALPYYRRAAALNATLASAAATATSDAGATAATEPGPLSFPVRLYYPVPSRTGRIATSTLPADQVDERFVEVQFTVTDEGEVSDARITGSSGTARETADALSAIRAARFRPKFVNGEPVATTGMTNREVFRTRKEGVEGGR